LSSEVEKIFSFVTGIGVFLGVKIDITPPRIFMPRHRGVTSNKTKSFYFLIAFTNQDHGLNGNS